MIKKTSALKKEVVYYFDAQFKTALPKDFQNRPKEAPWATKQENAKL